MNSLRFPFRWKVLSALPLLASLIASAAQTPMESPQAPNGVGQSGPVVGESYTPALIESGRSLFEQDCSFCHGRDAGGGETGPDLTRSKLVTDDVNGNKISIVMRNGRPEKGMPPFEFSDQQIAGLTAFIHTQQNEALSKKGRRRGVEVSDLQTGDVDAGKKYFNGAGRCATCHSPTGDLSGIASRYEGLKLEQQMLYPRNAKPKITVTLASGQTITGTLAYLDEFSVGLVDPSGVYRSWRTAEVQYKIDGQLDAHVELFSEYTDTDIHDLMAYLQTLR
jgi:cytochrome c oxidase cbb3-type subunit 3